MHLAQTALVIAFVWTACRASDAPWKRHTIDASSRGADGVRVADVNGDGRPDLVTGWEEGGRVRAYLNPGPKEVKSAWPAVTVGRVRSPEDAAFADLDGDGAVDVVSCCEGRTRTVFIHWAPEQKDYLNESAWKTAAIPASAGKAMWMFCLPMQIDGKHGVDLVVGAKGRGAAVGWFQSPENPRDPAGWRWRPLYKAGWIMSLIAVDMDLDGDRDVLLTDRKGASRGCHWLENPGAKQAADSAAWKLHTLGGAGREVMFADTADVDGDGRLDVLTAVKGAPVVWFRRVSQKPLRWETHEIPMPANMGTAKAVAAKDLDGDGALDLVITCENAKGKSGACWLKRDAARPATEPASWSRREISGVRRGVKFDLIRLLDLDADGDLDVITCEERDNLGVIWYENPHR